MNKLITYHPFFFICLLFIVLSFCVSKTIISQQINTIELINYTYLGNPQRNYYGNKAPEKLNIIWKTYLGEGYSIIPKTNKKVYCKGAGRTNQPLLFKENKKLYVLQSGCNHKIKKIDAINGETVWEYEYDDVINSTGTIWECKKCDSSNRYQLIQGSKKGINYNKENDRAECLRSISIKNGKEIWRYNVKKTPCYSRDVDGSGIICNDSLFIGLENGTLAIINPTILDHKNKKNYPKTLNEIPLYNDSDVIKHNHNLVTESSPSILNNHIYIASGSGHIFGYNKKLKKIDWDYYIGADIDGSTVITKDSSILIGFEKEFLEGNGGVLKISPLNNNVSWFFPIKNSISDKWAGGVIGSVGVNDMYTSENSKLAAFIGVDGVLYVVNHNVISDNKVDGPHRKNQFFSPKLLFQKKIGLSISTPIFIGNKLIAASSEGLWLFEILNDKIELIDHFMTTFESTPVVHNNRIYIASTDGYLYCFGKKNS